MCVKNKDKEVETHRAREQVRWKRWDEGKWWFACLFHFPKQSKQNEMRTVYIKLFNATEQVYELYNTTFYEIMVSKDLNKQLEHRKQYAAQRYLAHLHSHRVVAVQSRLYGFFFVKLCSCESNVSTVDIPRSSKTETHLTNSLDTMKFKLYSIKVLSYTHKIVKVIRLIR